MVKNKLQAWEILRGTPAPVAAGRIHSDMEAGFIRAKVVSADELIEVGDLHAIQAAGHVRTIGKDHEIARRVPVQRVKTVEYQCRAEVP